MRYEKCDEGLECVKASISPNYICIKKIGNNAIFSKLILDTFFLLQIIKTNSFKMFQ